jgi:hypothetical protein
VRHLVVAVLTLAALPAAANERRFTYTHESLVLNPGDRELEPWVTVRNGKHGFYNRIDTRLEMEIGVAENLMTAFYLNMTGIATETETETELGGVSWELKYKLMDPVADSLGLALYGEITGEPRELELEGKIIVDKRIGSLLIAANLVGELEFEKEPHEEEEEGAAVVEEEEEEELEMETIVELALGLGYFVTDHVTIGVEARSSNIFHHGELEISALNVGPTLSYAGQNWWVALSFLPQLPALKTEEDTTYDVDDHERLEGRVIVGMML